MAPCSPGGGGEFSYLRADKAVSDIFEGNKERYGIEMENNEVKQKKNFE